MNVIKGRRRVLEAGILLLMTMLACTVLFAVTVKAWEPTGSYSLIIRKEFDFHNIPANVQALAKEGTYTFKIEGTRKVMNSNNEWEDVEVNETVKLPREENGKLVWESKTYKSEGPFRVTVTEITDNIDIEDSNGDHYNMSGSSTDASVNVNSRKHEVKLRNNSTIAIKRENNGEGTIWFHITNRPYDEHSTSNFKAFDEIFSLAAGEEKKITKLPSGDTLCAGIYTIEQIAAPDGYRLQLGERKETINAEKTGRFHINGTPGKLTLTAGGTPGDGVTHYFTIGRTETEYGDDTEFVPREISVSSGEDYVLDNLPKGGYTVTEYSVTKDANTQFSVTMPQTTKKSKSTYSSAPQYTNFRTFFLTDGTTYIKLDSWGPLYDVNKKKINDTSITYDFAYGWGNEKGGVTYSSVNGKFNAAGTYSLETPTARYPKTLFIGFRTQNVSNSAAKFLGVAWTEYTEKEVTKTFDKAGMRYTSGLTVDDRGWMTITAPVPKAGDSQKIVYYYKVENNKNTLIPGPDGATDREDTTVMLKAGQSFQLTGLKAGSYKITENVDWAPAGFTMKVEGYPFGTTEAGKTMNVKVGGRRDIVITKPSFIPLPNTCSHTYPEEVKDREYIFSVNQLGGAYKQWEVKVKAGESQTIALPEAGEYQIAPRGDSFGLYRLNYTDSGAVYGTAEGSTSQVTFTNAFSTGEYGYRYIHEYYVREEDGTYTYEGNSQITTRLGRKEGEEYQALDISQAPDFQGNHYKHFDEAYGWVDGISGKREGKEKLSDKVSTVSNAEKDKDSAKGEGKPSKEDFTAPKEDFTVSEESREPESSGEESTEFKESTEEESSEESRSAADDEEEGSREDETGSMSDQEEETREEETGNTANREEELSEETGSAEITDTSLEESQGSEDRNFRGIFSAMSFNDRLFKVVFTENNGIVITDENRGSVGESPKDDSEKERGSGDDGEEEKTHDEETSLNKETGSAAGKDEEESSNEETGSASKDEEESSNEETGSADKDEEESSNEETGSAGKDEEESSNEETGSAGEDEEESSKEESGSAAGKGEEESSKEENGSAADRGEEEKPKEEAVQDKDADKSSDKKTDGSEVRDFREAFDAASCNDKAYRDIALDDNGIVIEGNGQGSADELLNYGVEPDKDYIDVTKDASQIIILRYYRDRQPKGSYNLIHVYYFRDKHGDHWEGTSGILPQDGELGVKYMGEGVEKVTSPTNFEVNGRKYTYTYDGRPQYGIIEETGNGNGYDPGKDEYAGDGWVYRPNNDWTSAEGTEEGNQIIILRYYRELEGSYNIVHEYYFRKPGANLGGEAETLGDANGSDSSSEDEENASSPDEDSSHVFTGTLEHNDGFVYTFVGRTEIETVYAPLASTHTARDEDHKPEYKNQLYEYINAGYGTATDHSSYNCDPDKQWAVSTEAGDETIILRYCREITENPPGKPENPPEKPVDPPDNPGGSSDDPGDPPKDPRVPPKEPKDPPKPPEPNTPEYPTELPDPNDPDSPERITIMKDGVPLTYVKVWNSVTKQWMYILENEIPMYGLPKVGDGITPALWALLFAGAFGGACTVRARHIRDKEKQ